MQPFIHFGFSHWTVLALTVAASLALSWGARGAGAQAQKLMRFSLAALIFANWIALEAVFFSKGWITRGNILPMQLCDWATIATLIALIRPAPLPYALAYFWALGGTLQGLLSPSAVTRDFPDAAFILFFSFHMLILIGVAVLTLGCRMRPTREILPRVFLWSLAYLVAASIVNAFLGTNYGFTAEKPPSPTPYDLMPDWPFYLPVVVVLGYLSVLVYYAPFWIADWLRARAGKAYP